MRVKGNIVKCFLSIFIAYNIKTGLLNIFPAQQTSLLIIVS